jgi:CheY-like chemotaxis protein
VGIPLRVLVVDDEFPIALFVSALLEDLGCEVETVFDGNQALERLAGDPRIELLITDINMPGVSGYEVAERAPRVRPGLKIVLLSGAETDASAYSKALSGVRSDTGDEGDDRPLLW